MNNRIFISYSRKDVDFVRRLAADLTAAGAEVWLDLEDIPAGMKWSTAIQQGLNTSQLMVLVISPDSMASENVEDEWNYFKDKRKPIIPVYWRDCEKHFQLSRLQHVDFQNGNEYAAAFNKLLLELGVKGIRLADKPIFKLPDPFEWVKIPVGKVAIDGHGEFTVPAFEIAKYPITNAQFAKFIEDGGYQNKQWWTEKGWEAKEQGITADWLGNEEVTGKPWTEPRYWQDTDWNGVDCPVVGVTWYEGLAFCRWLGHKTSSKILLPTEQQWQWAAQGNDGRVYPWGNEWDCTRCNNSVDPCKSSQTTPVTRYPQGASPYGVMDMSGNVWEWTLTAYENASNNDINSNALRVLRGGAWFFNSDLRFRVDYRGWGYVPHDWLNLRGFRCARS